MSFETGIVGVLRGSVDAYVSVIDSNEPLIEHLFRQIQFHLIMYFMSVFYY